MSLTPKSLRSLRAATSRLGISATDIIEALVRSRVHAVNEAVMTPGVIRAPRSLRLTAEASSALSKTQRRLATGSASPIIEVLIDQYLPSLTVTPAVDADPVRVTVQ